MLNLFVTINEKRKLKKNDLLKSLITECVSTPQTCSSETI